MIERAICEVCGQELSEPLLSEVKTTLKTKAEGIANMLIEFMGKEAILDCYKQELIEKICSELSPVKI